MTIQYRAQRGSALRVCQGRPRASRIALAFAWVLAASAPAFADFTSTGAVNMLPSSQPVPSGPGSANLASFGLEVGAAAAGSFQADGGSTLTVGQIILGSQNAAAQGALTLDGAGTALTLSRLSGDGGSFIGYSGTGALTVSGGATLDGRSQTGNCLASSAMFCNTFVGTAMGSSGTLTVTGAGSKAGFLRSFIVGGVQPFGTPGAAKASYVNVLAGGSLVTDNANLGSPGSSSADKSFAEVLVDGPGSIWRITGASIAPTPGRSEDLSAYFIGGYGVNSTAKVTITNGGSLQFGITTGANLNLASNGRAELTVDGAGSSVRFQGSDGIMNIGRRSLLPATTATPGTAATGMVTVRNGASISGVGTLSVARDGSAGSLAIDGAGSTVRVDGLTPTGNAIMTVGRGVGSGSKGTVTLDHGGTLVVAANAASVSTTPAQLVVGRDAGSEGTLTASGGSSVTAAWVGIGRFRNSDGSSSTGGKGTLVLNDSNLITDRLVVGSQGIVSGAGGRISAGTFENHGILNPGNSPGTLFIDGNYVGAVGSRIVLEVASNGHGGFTTDMLVFAAGHTIDLTQSAIEFRFLGTANPYTFKQAGEFDIDTFLKLDLGAGALGALAKSSYQGAVFTASSQTYDITGFSYAVEQHVASFATPVPEPSTWAMMVCGAGLMAWRARRRRGPRIPTAA